MHTSMHGCMHRRMHKVHTQVCAHLFVERHIGTIIDLVHTKHAYPIKPDCVPAINLPCACIRALVCARAHICTFAFVRVRVLTSMHVCARGFMQVFVHTCVCVRATDRVDRATHLRVCMCVCVRAGTTMIRGIQPGVRMIFVELLWYIFILILL